MSKADLHKNIYDRYFGVEVEFYSHLSKTRISNEISKLGYKCIPSQYHTSDYSVHRIKNDSSLHTDAPKFSGYEFVSRPMKLKDLKELQKIIKLLANLGSSLNSKSAFHLHIEVKDYQLKDFKSLINFTYKWRNIIKYFMPASRRSNGYTKFLKKDTVLEINKIKTQPDLIYYCRQYNRHQVLNLRSFPKIGTVEFRGHSGTLEIMKIRYWILLHLAIIEKCKFEVTTLKPSLKRKNREIKHFFEKLSSCLNGSTYVSNYFYDRYKGFKVKEELKQSHPFFNVN